jgi:hypothetical protein
LNGVPVDTQSNGASRPASVEPEIDPTLRRWRELLDSLRESDPKLAAFLEHAQAVEVGPKKIVIRYEKASVVEVALKDETNKAILLEKAHALLGERPTLHTEPAVAKLNGDTVFSVDRDKREAQHQADIAAAKSHELVQEAIRVLGARVKTIELPKS